MTDKIKLLTISDHPLVPSGVGTQTRYLLEGLLKTGKYTIRSLGGAMEHQDYRPVKLEQYGEDWIIIPVNGYGNPQMIRDLLDSEKPDALWFMTDPRFYVWLFEMSDEIRDRGIPLLYNHVWDELPVPKYNKPYYQSCDFVGCISKLTHHILCELGMSDKSQYIPHAVDSEVFKPLPGYETSKAKAEILGQHNANKFVVFYNSRNARRKMTADVLHCFRQFADMDNKKDVLLFMHTDPFDKEGCNLHAVAEMVGLKPEQILFSSKAQPADIMAKFYNISDVTINISNNEGWGLSCHEALSCGKLAIVTKTGGLQDQIISDDNITFGACIDPATTSIQGSQQIPYIFDRRVADKDVVDALENVYRQSPSEREALGLKARQWTLKAFPMSRMVGSWDSALTKYINQYKTHGHVRRIKVANF